MEHASLGIQLFRRLFPGWILIPKDFAKEIKPNMKQFGKNLTLSVKVPSSTPLSPPPFFETFFSF